MNWRPSRVLRSSSRWADEHDPAGGARRHSGTTTGESGGLGVPSVSAWERDLAGVGECNKAREAGSNPPSRALCKAAAACGGPGGQHLYCASCDPTTHVRVSLRDRRDTRPHADHLPCHPDVRRPTVQGPAAIDGAHAGARAVRPGGQVDAPLRHLQARRHRRVHAAARTGSREDDTPFIKRVIGLGGDTVEIRDGNVFINGTELDEPYLFATDARRSAATDHRPRRRDTGGSSRTASCS